MKFAAVLLCSILVAGLSNCNKAQAQVVFNPQGMTVTPVNNGTGTIVSVPIPGGSGLAVSVATGSAALPLENIAGTAGATHLQLGDDSMSHVPLGFSFPFYGQNFTSSWMSSNGFVSYTGNIPGAGCCGGQNLTTLRDSTYNYIIAPLWTDLIDTTGNATWYKGNSTSMTYGWYGTKEYGTNNSSTFELNINSSGGINVKYGGAFVSTGHTVTAGMTGNLANGEYFQYYHGQGFSVPSTGLSWSANGTGAVDQCVINPLSSTTCSGYQAAYTAQQCTISALYNPSCPGYSTAYFTQQCTVSALYDSSCPGYAAAYTTQQCSINPLYSTTCSGYQQAYHDQQCSVNSLYATDCPGYAAAYLDQQCSINPLYSTTCSGYQQAYHDQQCTISPLYATDCQGYAVAYHDQQCSINPLYATDCRGYATAYHDQQCSANPLYATDCTGYASAYHNQQCTANPLYMTDCVGYAQAYFSQQCSLNGLYDRSCPNYSTAYTTRMVLEQQNMASTVATAGVVAQTAPAVTTTTQTTTPTTTTSTTTTGSVTPTISNNGTVSVAPSATGNATVDKAIATPQSSAAPAAAPAAPVQLVAQAPAPAGPAPTSPSQQSPQGSGDKKSDDKPSGEKKQEEKKSDGDKPAGPTQMAGGQQDGNKDQPKTARQEIAERKAEAQKKEASANAKNLANEMGKASNMEAQKQMQTVVIQAMSFKPGFDVYSQQLIVQSPFYAPVSVYKNQQTVDNRTLGRGLFGPTDQLHNEMVDSQYNRGN